MYDKYFIGNSFSVGHTTTKLPKHKGILFQVNTASTSTVGLNMLNSAGNTFNIGLCFAAAGPTVFPFQVYNVTALGAGITGFFIN
jgi:hypothetical protein